MLRFAAVLLMAGLMAPLPACGDPCESVQQEIEEVGREIQRDPGAVLERTKELEALQAELERLGCLG